MNSQYPIPPSTSSFTPFDPNPNPNPKPNFSNPQFQSQTPLSNLPISLSSLKTLLQSSKSTLDSLSTFLPSSSSNSLLQCPSNPNHWVPPSSLFHHSLHCPSPLHVGPLLDTLNYPKTQNPIHRAIDKFVHDPTSDLCFSIDDFVDFESNFFYQGCHGVVGSVNDDVTKKIFTLPRVLSVECSNFVVTDNDVFSGSGVRMLPSEMWVVEKELELWSDCPNAYSYSVIGALLCLSSVSESELLMWLIVNSPRFGVVIDVPMRNHMCVLFRVCLKAMVREATHCYETLLKSDEGDKCQKLDPKSLRFKCPVMVEAIRWLVSQLSILYGEMNAKGFVIAMLGHMLRNAVSCALLIPLDRKSEKTSLKPSREIVESKEDGDAGVRMFSKSIFVYQIAAAVAALHEKSLLDERNRALWNPPQLTTYQRMVEHQYFSKKADEERQKRPDYRPLIEHDSILSQQQNDQETNRLKTREELLAEERDYKRRRMSYRGKKLKRSSKEVMRDIIEEYMEAIKKTGGIGGLANEDSGEMSTWKNTSTQKSTNLETNHDLENDQQDGYKTLLDSGYKTRDKNSDPSPCREEQQKSESYYYRNHGQTNGDRCNRDYHSRSPSRDRRHSQSKEHRSHRRNERITEMDDNEGSSRNYSTSSTQRSPSGRRDKRKKESSERSRWSKHENDERGSYGRNQFSDRYDPSEDDQFIDSYFTRPES